MGSILIVINNTNYYRKIESLLANQFVGGWPKNIETVDCKSAGLKKPSVAKEVCQQLLLKNLRYPKLNRLLKIHKYGGPWSVFATCRPYLPAVQTCG
jgi:hypothetical protein